MSFLGANENVINSRIFMLWSETINYLPYCIPKSKKERENRGFNIRMWFGKLLGIYNIYTLGKNPYPHLGSIVVFDSNNPKEKII